MEVNPYEILGISPDSPIYLAKNKFREIMKKVRYNNEKRAMLCLANDVILNPELYIKDKNNIFLL